jgi:DNA-3-methyladenine glycosylase II
MQKITDEVLQGGVKHLKMVDPILGNVIDQVGPLLVQLPNNYFLALVESIVSQQLSVKAADTIFARLQGLTTDSELTAELVLAMDPQIMRNAGLSWSKVRYVKNIAEYTLTSDKVFENFPQMSDEEIIAELIKIKGVGRWTAEMFLLFTMGRPDIFSHGDLGLRRAIERLYGFKKEPTSKQIDKIANIWKPYRSIASRYLWKSLEIR